MYDDRQKLQPRRELSTVCEGGEDEVEADDDVEDLQERTGCRRLRRPRRWTAVEDVRDGIVRRRLTARGRVSTKAARRVEKERRKKWCHQLLLATKGLRLLPTTRLCRQLCCRRRGRGGIRASSICAGTGQVPTLRRHGRRQWSESHGVCRCSEAICNKRGNELNTPSCKRRGVDWCNRPATS